MNPYYYVNGHPEYKIREKERTARWQRYYVSFPSAKPTRYEKNNLVCGEYLVPANARQAPLVILVHGLGEYGAIPCQFLAKTLVKQGYACFVLYQVFHTIRMPDTVRKRMRSLTADEWYESYLISVVDICQVIDWAAMRPELDSSNIAVAGISFGGLVSSIAMGIDDRIRAGIFIVSGGNSGKIAWLSDHRLTKNKPYTSEDEFRQAQERYQSYLNRVEESGFENVIPSRRDYVIDPLTFAGMLRKRPVLMINALWDKAIPKPATIDFWQACGEPPITWLPATHPGIWVWYPVITRRISSMLSSSLS